MNRPHTTMLQASLLIFVIVICNGCATIFTGTTDEILIESDPAGARIMVDGIEQGRTPATIEVKRPGIGDKQVTLQLQGYDDRVFTLQKEFNTAAIFNMVGFFGWAIDVATGAVTRCNPKSYRLELRPASQPQSYYRGGEGFSGKELETGG